MAREGLQIQDGRSGGCSLGNRYKFTHEEEQGEGMGEYGGDGGMGGRTKGRNRKGLLRIQASDVRK